MSLVVIGISICLSVLCVYIKFRRYTYIPVAREADSRQVATVPYALSAQHRMPTSVALAADAVFRGVKLRIFSARSADFPRFCPNLLISRVQKNAEFDKAKEFHSFSRP